MTEAELTLVNLDSEVKAALQAALADTGTAVRQQWPKERTEGTVVTWQEYDNRSTDCGVVDAVEYQIDLWAERREVLTALTDKVNRAMLELGLKRTYLGPAALGNGALERRTMRFGRKVDKRSMRLVD